MRRIPPLAAVRVFEAAARHQNFTAAAAELGMTQAAVSYQIRILEERLGAPLFLREKRRVTLSEAGRRAAPLISSAFDTISDAFAGVRAESDSVLAISTTHSFANIWMAPRLGRFQIQHPDVAVRLSASDEVVDFARDEIDVAVRGGAGNWPGLRQHFLFRVTLTPMCSPAFCLEHRLEGPADVLRVPRIVQTSQRWHMWFASVGLEPAAPERPYLRLDSQAIEGQAAMAGQGVALLTPALFVADLAAGRLIMPFDHFVFEGPSFFLVYPEHKRNLPKIRAIREWLLAEMAEQAKGGPVEAYVEVDAA